MIDLTYWKNELPKTWKLIPIKAGARYAVSSIDKVIKEDEIPVLLCNYTDVYKNDFITNDIEFMPGSATEAELESFKIEIGDVIITKDSESWDDIAIPALVKETKENLVCGYHLAVIKANREKLNPEFLFRCLQSKEIRLQMELASTGVTRYGLPKDAIGRTLIPVPQIEKQVAIVEFIQIKISEIDKLIVEKKKLLKLLGEQRQALITQAVTRGINPNVKLKDSGIEWLGKIPQQWKNIRLKFITNKIGSGVTPKGGASVYQDEGIPLLRSQNIHFDGLRLEDVAYISPEIHSSMKNTAVLEGDVLLNITGASIGRCFYYDGSIGEANVNQHVCIIRPNSNINTQYLYFLLSSDIGQLQIDLNQEGGGREGLSFESIKDFIFPIPEYNEQLEIISKIKKGLDLIDMLIKLTNSSVDLLQEKRATLITAAVTGKINI